MKSFKNYSRKLVQRLSPVAHAFRTAAPVVVFSAAALTFAISISLAALPRQAGAPVPAPAAPAAAIAPRVGVSGLLGSGLSAVPAVWLGYSGELRAVIGTSSKLLAEASTLGFSIPSSAQMPGIHELGLATPGGAPFYFVSLLPFSTKKGEGMGGYRIGNWPSGATSGRYAPPAGLIQVTPDNEATAVSQQFRLKDFLTHDQQDVWPKYLVLKPTLVDKLELISSELKREGLPGRLHVMSGFRTPQYNAQGVGEGGRARMSRHMYGDASDVFVDADGNGWMDDLNGDGKSTVADARVLFRAAERVEREHPELVGGLSAYPSNGVHGPFVHVDTRGVKARW